MKKRKIVICLSCGKKVYVDLVDYGKGQVARCPICKKLAYSEIEGNK